MNSYLISESDLEFRRVKAKELSKFMEYAFESTRDFAENEIGISFKFLNKLLFINRILFGIPLKIIARNVVNVCVDYDGEMIAGFSMAYIKDDDLYELGNVFTRPQFQGRGVANILMKHIISSYQDKKIKLGVNVKNETALHIYKKHGFIVKSSIQEYIFPVPLSKGSLAFPDGYYARKAVREDLKQMTRIMKEVPNMKDLQKSYKNSFNKTKRKKFRFQYQLPAVLIKKRNSQEEIVGIGRACWSRATPKLAQIFASAVLSEAEESYSAFVNYLTIEVQAYGIEKGSWERKKRTEQFFTNIQPYLGEPVRIGYSMEYSLENSVN